MSRGLGDVYKRQVEEEAETPVDGIDMSAIAVSYTHLTLPTKA
ncbi:hypothetical protein JMUB7529_28490 [Staphylococcus aureus]